jgi:hypothetical protein
MRLARALRYALGPRVRRDLTSLVRFWTRPVPDILFFSGSQVDLQWVLPTYEAAVGRGLRCVLAGPDLVVPEGSTYQDLTGHALRLARARIMVTATTGLSPARMPHFCRRRVAMPHSLVSLHVVYPAGTFDGYTEVFCCGEHHVAEIEAMNRRDGIVGRRPVLVGYAKFERLMATRPTAPTRHDARPHVLIGPSWGVGNLLETTGEALIARLIAAGYDVTLRPHPAFFIEGGGLMAGIRDRFGDLPGFALESSMEESRALWTSDLMIADYSGFAMEFAFIRERPVLYVDVPRKVLNPGWRELGVPALEVEIRERIGMVVRPAIDEVLSGLATLARNPDGWRERIRLERERDWANFGRCGQVSAAELCTMLAGIDHVGNT